MSVNGNYAPNFKEYPPRADLRKEITRPLPVIAPGTVDGSNSEENAVNIRANDVLDKLNAALDTQDAQKLATCFYEEQAYWRDVVALTYHVRTFKTRETLAAALLETRQLRGFTGVFKFESARLVTPTPVLQFIDCRASFRTSSPGATCNARLLLLPKKVNNVLSWKIWILSTWIENLDLQPEDEEFLQSPSRKLDGVETIHTDVVIIGGGNSAASIAARLKALRIDNIMFDRNARVGDNWALRYDNLRFHIPTASCEMPYLRYAPELQSPHLLNREDLAGHMKKYVATFGLNVVNAAVIQTTLYDQAAKQWTIKFSTPSGDRTAICKQLVQATGIGSQIPYTPPIADADVYKGISIHSASYKNTNGLVEKGAKSVAIIGSANTAFDVIEDCYAAGLKTTMVARSPTYILPFNYTQIPTGLGAYDVLPIDVVDKMFSTLPEAVGTQFTHGSFRNLASKEPDRYKALIAAGFPGYDSRHPDAHLAHHILERAGGHYVDVGGCDYIADGRVAVRGNVEPVGYTPSGVRLSDGSILEADAVIWCTGFADKDARATVASILGGGEKTDAEVNGFGTTNGEKTVLGPRDIADRLDATWGLDPEGELRGMYKRHLRMENYWVMGGTMSQQRVWSRPLAQEIKLAVDGSLPPAYRDTPKPVDVQ